MLQRNTSVSFIHATSYCDYICLFSHFEFNHTVIFSVSDIWRFLFLHKFLHELELYLNQTSYLVLMLDNFENLTSVIWTHDYRGIQNKDVCHKGVGLSCLDIFHCTEFTLFCPHLITLSESMAHVFIEFYSFVPRLFKKVYIH